MSPWLSDAFLSSQSDARLVGLARTGHDRAFAAIVARYRRQLLAFARRLSSDGRAEDLVQQAFLSAFVALRSGAEVQHLRGWLYQIVRNAAIRTSGVGRLEAELDPESVSTGHLEDAVGQRMLAFSALSEVARLPERQRDALVGTAIHGYSRAEIASSLGLSEGAVRQLVHRARATVRGAVTAITPYPLVEWFAAARSAPVVDRVAQLVFGASSASAGRLALKLGAVVAAGVAATSVGSSQLQGHASRPPGMSSHRAVSEASGAPSGGFGVQQPAYAVLVSGTTSPRDGSRTTSTASIGGAASGRRPQRRSSGRGSAGSGRNRSTSGTTDGRGESEHAGSAGSPSGTEGQHGGRDTRPEGPPGVGNQPSRGGNDQSSDGPGAGHGGETLSGGGRVSGGGDASSTSTPPAPGGDPSSATTSSDAGVNPVGGATKDAGRPGSTNDSGSARALGSDSVGGGSSRTGGSS